MSDEHAELGGLRPSMRPFITALLANLALAVALLGWPYLRGRERAQESARGVVALSACLLDGTPRQNLGLALPLGERERFATLYEHAPADWPSRCAPLLDRIQHEPAIFLLPSPKAAELDLDEAIDDMATALLDLASQRERHEGGVPEAPLERLAVLRGMVASLLTANDIEVDANEVGLDLGPIEVAPLPAPSRIPVRTGAGAFHVESAPSPLLRVVASDGLGIAEVEVSAPPSETEPARVRVLQLRRPGGARGVLAGREDAWLAWTTPDATCDADERHCAMRATGLGRLLEGSHVMRPEHWIAAHPAGPIERSIAVGDARFTVVARTPEGGAEARVFERGEPIPPPPPNEHPEPPPPTRAVASRPMPGAIDWVASDGRVAMLERTEAGLSLRLMLLGADPASDVVVALGAEAERLEPCGDAFVALGPTHAQIVRGASAWPAFAHGARAPIVGSTHAESSVHLACDAGTVFLGALDRAGALTVHACDATTASTGCRNQRWPIADVTAFDLATHDDGLWVASSGDADAPSIHVGLSGSELPRVVAACWSSGHGFCGPARWAVPRRGGDGPLVLTARDGSDVLALRLDGDRFAPLPGLSTGS
jgi:hypothetical protein